MTDLDRLSALDAAFLDLETERAPLNVGWTLRFAGPAPSLAALRRHLEGRLDAVPRFRRRVVRPALGLGDPHWADDAGFDIARHVEALRLAAPADQEALRDLAGVLFSAPLDRRRPLWRMTLVSGLEPAPAFAIVGVAHHALVDGIAAIEIAQLLFDPAGVTPLPRRPAAWTPRPARGAPAALAVAARQRASGGAAAGQALARNAATSPEALRQAVGAAGSLVRPAPRTSLERSAGRARRAAFAVVPLEEVRAAARLHGATLNDALLTAAAIATGAALERRGEHPPAVRALVPASVRTGAEGAAEHGNRIAFLAVDLPLGEDDPARLLRTIRARTRARKNSGDAAAGDALLRAADLLPATVRGRVARAAAQAARFTLIVSNVPGPPVPLALLGRDLVGAWPAVPPLDGHALTIGALSYCGRLHAGLLADAAVVPDLDEIAADLGPPSSACARLRHRRSRRGASAPVHGAPSAAAPELPGPSARGEAVHGTVERDDVDPPARVLPERAELAHRRHAERPVTARPRELQARSTDLALAEVAVDVAPAQCGSPGSRTT